MTKTFKDWEADKTLIGLRDLFVAGAVPTLEEGKVISDWMRTLKEEEIAFTVMLPLRDWYNDQADLQFGGKQTAEDLRDRLMDPVHIKLLNHAEWLIKQFHPGAEYVGMLGINTPEGKKPELVLCFGEVNPETKMIPVYDREKLVVDPSVPFKGVRFKTPMEELALPTPPC